MINANLIAVAYVISGIFFIMALRGLSSPESSRRGNIFGMLGMLIAVLATLLSVDFFIKEFFTIVSCETCGFVFTNPRPSEKDLEKYYVSDMYISHTNQKLGLFNWLYQTVRRYTIKRKIKLLKKTAAKGAHLDIGCGTGTLLAKIKPAFGVGIDISSKMILEAK